jgi:hypothetical protein
MGQMFVYGSLLYLHAAVYKSSTVFWVLGEFKNWD